MPVDALVLDKLAWMPRLLALRELGRRADHDEPQVARDGHGDHVPVDHLTEPDTRVVACRDDIDWFITHKELELNVRMMLQEADEYLTAQKTLRGAGDVKLERAARFVAEFAHRGHHCS